MDPIYDKDLESFEDDLEDLQTTQIRSSHWVHKTFVWADHIQQLLHEDRFDIEYRMSLQAFSKLHSILQVKLRRRIKLSRLIRPVTVEMVIGTGLRYLAGGKMNDIRHIFFLSKTECYNCIDSFLEAVNSSKALCIHLPQTPAEWERVRNGFSSKSSHQLMSGCVGAIDGLLAQIIAPRRTEVGNVRAYYSGHYETFGLNCQAACDVRLKFLYFAVVAPGKTNDNAAYPLCVQLRRAIQSLPLGLYFVGDAAYSLEENLLVPFTGSQRHDPVHDAFNFHLSQMRIRIEMAFGRLVRKFQVLKRKMEGKLPKISQIFGACARLHNYIIDNDMPIDSINEEADHLIIPLPNAPSNMGYLPVMFEEDDDTFEKVDGVSETQKAILDVIRQQGITRPQYNLDRNTAQLDDDLSLYYHPT